MAEIDQAQADNKLDDPVFVHHSKMEAERMGGSVGSNEAEKGPAEEKKKKGAGDYLTNPVGGTLLRPAELLEPNGNEARGVTGKTEAEELEECNRSLVRHVTKKVTNTLTNLQAALTQALGVSPAPTELKLEPKNAEEDPASPMSPNGGGSTSIFPPTLGSVTTNTPRDSKGGGDTDDEKKGASSPKETKKRDKWMLKDAHSDHTSKALQICIENPGKITDYYDLSTKLGNGAFGSVNKGVVKATGAERAVKKIAKEPMKTHLHFLHKEIEISKMVDHPNVVTLYEIFEDHDHLYLVLELCLGGDLHARVKRVGVPEKDAATIMVQLIRAVYYLHKNMIAHRDLKSQNVLVTNKAPKARMSEAPSQFSDSNLRITDFGLSCTFTKGQVLKGRVGTVTHMSPQVLEKAYNESCDVWALGVISYECLFGRLPFKGENEDDTAKLVKIGRFKLGSEGVNMAPETIMFIRQLIQVNVSRRLTAPGALSSSFLKRFLPARSIAHSVDIRPEMLDSLRGFRSLNKFKRASLSVIATLLTDDQIRQPRNAFTELDADGDGAVSASEVRAYLTELKLEEIDMAEIEQAVLETFEADGKELSSEEMDELRENLKRQSIASNVKVEREMPDFCYTEFIAATFDRENFLGKKVARVAFQAFDRDNSQFITLDELIDGRLMGKLAQADIDQLMKDFDDDGDGQISYDEFLRIMQSGEGWKNCFSPVNSEKVVARKKTRKHTSDMLKVMRRLSKDHAPAADPVPVGA